MYMNDVTWPNIMIISFRYRKTLIKVEEVSRCLRKVTINNRAVTL